ncbi:MAG: zinc-binding alcohol dehydrogenase [Bellilinea sp.]
MISGQSIYFTAPGQVTIRSEMLAPPDVGEVLVQTMLSAVSSGTESLVFQGLAPENMELDANIGSLRGNFRYPFKYGYACVGQVTMLGPGVDNEWQGRRVFAFNPHESHFIARVDALIPLPADLTDEDASFLANMETAINFIHDGAPLIGESVLVLGLGVVGMLTLAQLARFPLTHLYALDRYPLRRRIASRLGNVQVLDAEDPAILSDLHNALAAHGFASRGADLVYEISGSPDALNLAINAAGYNGRVVIGSWYGRKKSVLDLGGAFHRNRIQLVSSQVSSLAPEISGRWTKERRLALALQALHSLHPGEWITHRFPFTQADQAYQQLVLRPEESFQIVLTY